MRYATSCAAFLAFAGALHAQTPEGVDVESAARGLRLFEDACARDAGAFWGVSLCGPVVLVHPATRAAVASVPDPAGGFTPQRGVYTGRLPDGLVVANTSVEWGGRRWTMALLPLPQYADAIVALIGHEAFHRIQSQLSIPAADPAAVHLAERDGRLWLRMELRALSAAVGAGGAEARQHVRDALLFRAWRYRLYPGSDSIEAQLERHEGLAEYTGLRLGYGAAGERAVPGLLDSFERRPSYVRSMAYGTGPVLGVLLDRYAPGWRTRVATITSLADELRRAAGVSAQDPRLGADSVVAAAARYGYAAVAAAEDALVSARDARLAAYRSALVDGPVLALRTRNFRGSFDPNEVVTLGAAGTVYPAGSFGGEWGTVEVRDGILVAPDFTTLTLAAPAAEALAPLLAPASPDAVVETAAWTLRLNPGWFLTSGARPGDWMLVPPDPS